MAVLIIGMSESRCGECRRGADPMEKSHQTVLGWGLEQPPGCGAVWTQVSSSYIGLGIPERIQQMRPDLEFVHGVF